MLATHGLQLPARLSTTNFTTSIRERAEKSTEKSKNIEKNSETKSNEVGEEARYSIVTINGGRKAVLIKDNIRQTILGRGAYLVSN